MEENGEDKSILSVEELHQHESDTILPFYSFFRCIPIRFTCRWVFVTKYLERNGNKPAEGEYEKRWNRRRSAEWVGGNSLSVPFLTSFWCYWKKKWETSNERALDETFIITRLVKSRLTSWRRNSFSLLFFHCSTSLRCRNGSQLPVSAKHRIVIATVYLYCSTFRTTRKSNKINWNRQKKNGRVLGVAKKIK